MEQIRDLVLTVARALVDNPERVKVNVIEGSNTYVFELSVARFKDMLANPESEMLSALREPRQGTPG